MNKAKLTIVEFDYHAEVLRDFCKVMNDTMFHINVFTTARNWKKVGISKGELGDNFTLFIKPKSEPVKSFVLKHRDEVERVDLVFFSTIASNFRLFKDLSYKGVVLVRIHNANAYFNPLYKSYRPILKMFFIWKDTSHFIRNTIGRMDWFFRGKFLEKADYYVFPNDIIQNYSIKQFNIPASKALMIPLAFANNGEARAVTNFDNVLKIVVIGKVDQRNRDYESLLEGFELLCSRIDFSIQLTFLGSSNTKYGNKITDKFKNLENENFKFISYKGFVDQKEFDSNVKRADFFIIPVKVNTRYTIYSEIYGSTKISGSINDILKYRKPALISSGYKVGEDFKEIMETYSSPAELANKVFEWKHSQVFTSMPIDKALYQYRIEIIRNNITALFLSLIK